MKKQEKSVMMTEGEYKVLSMNFSIYKYKSLNKWI